MRKYGATFDDALAAVRDKRRIRPNDNFMEQLRVWEAVRYEIWVDEVRKIPKPAYAAYLTQRAARLEKAGLTGNEPVRVMHW